MAEVISPHNTHTYTPPELESGRGWWGHGGYQHGYRRTWALGPRGIEVGEGVAAREQRLSTLLVAVQTLRLRPLFTLYGTNEEKNSSALFKGRPTVSG